MGFSCFPESFGPSFHFRFYSKAERALAAIVFDSTPVDTTIRYRQGVFPSKSHICIPKWQRRAAGSSFCVFCKDLLVFLRLHTFNEFGNQDASPGRRGNWAIIHSAICIVYDLFWRATLAARAH
ncbi:MAG TPA: hypothetical protein VED17_03365 [Nitrososphaerales archaeon]|nr:hypothetical protein [Nitrososphaerales archaeon]